MLASPYPGASWFYHVLPWCWLEVTKTALKFVRKWHAARLLSARLFHSDKDREELKNEIYATEIYRAGDQKLLEVLKLGTSKLQQWVRGSWLCDGVQTDTTKRFVNSIVKPSLSVNVASVPEAMVSAMGRYLTILTGEEASEVDVANIRIACAALSGDLSSHPFVQGLTLQAARLVEKRQRRITTMQGRRSKETERETALIADAGLSLALFAGNVSLAKEFGLAASSLKVSLDVLKTKSLPTPALAVNWPSVLQENFQLADQRFIRAQSSPRCYLDDVVSDKFFASAKPTLTNESTDNLILYNETLGTSFCKGKLRMERASMGTF